MIFTLFFQVVKLLPIPINNSVKSIVHTHFLVSSHNLHCYTHLSKHQQSKVIFLNRRCCGGLPVLRVLCREECCSLDLTSKKGPHGHSIAPPHTGVGRRMETKRQNSCVRIRANEANSNNSNTDKRNTQKK